jgi:hypothetical protein
VTDRGPFRDQPNSRKERDVESALHLLRRVDVPYGLNERVEARLSAARLVQKTAVPSPWFRARIAASVLAVAVTSAALAIHFSRAVPDAAMPAAARHVPAAGVQAAGAIRVPVKPVEAPATGESRSARVKSNAHASARHSVLSHGVVPQHAVEAADENPPTAAPMTTP